ncbi:MAG: glycosyltransferase family 4 protein [Chloroflexi bacterium]|nr:glycosyltransferase family 4 protein [Chloroflexota bacterium]
MHVLMLCALDVWALHDRGGAPSLYRTLLAYGKRGHRVTVIAPTIGANAQLPPEGLRSTKPSPLTDLPGVTFQRFHLPSLQESRLPLTSIAKVVDQKLRFAFLYPYLASRRAEQFLRNGHIDVLYGYEVHGLLAVRTLRRHGPGLPVIARYQGTVLHPHLNSKLALLRRFEEVRAMRSQADLYIMTNDGTRGDAVLAQLNPSSAGKVRFWRNGLDLDRLRPAEPETRRKLRADLGVPDDAFVLLTASRLAHWKRVDRVVAAMPAIINAVPNAQLIVVGDGDERASLERQARDLGVQNSVRITGSVPHEDVLSYMQVADLFLAPADLSNVGNPLMEAMCCGMAIVAVDAGETSDLIRDGETGRLLAMGSPAAISQVVIELAGDTAQSCRLGAEARQEATKRFWTWEQRMTAELEAVEALVASDRLARRP